MILSHPDILYHGRNLISIHSTQKVFHENKMLKNADLKYSGR